MKHHQSVTVRGKHDDLLAFTSELSKQSNELEIGDPTPIVRKLGDRNPMAQLEWFEVAIHFGTSMAAHVAVEIIKHIANEIKKKGRNVTVHDAD